MKAAYRPELDFAWPLLPFQHRALMDAYYTDKRVYSGLVEWKIKLIHGDDIPMPSDKFPRRWEAIRAAILKYGDRVRNVRA